MVLLKQLTDDAQYSYIANLYPGMRAFDYLTEQLAIWMNNGHSEFNIALDMEFYLTVKHKETIPKSLRSCIEINDHGDKIGKAIIIPCIGLQSPSPDPDETGAVTLWYDIIELGSKRAERSLIRILDLYMDIDSSPYSDIKSTRIQNGR